MKNNHGQVSWMLVAVASFAVVAVWQLAVRPLANRYHADRAGYEAALAELERGRADRAAVPVDPAVLLAELQATAASYEAVFQSLAGASSTYDRFDPIARAAGVTIKRLEPNGHGSVFKDGPAEVATSSFVIECEGTLDAVAGFVDRIQHDNGLSRVTSIRIVPVRDSSGGGELVHLSLKTDHVTIAHLFDGEEVEE